MLSSSAAEKNSSRRSRSKSRLLAMRGLLRAPEVSYFFAVRLSSSRDMEPSDLLNVRSRWASTAGALAVAGAAAVAVGGGGVGAVMEAGAAMTAGPCAGACAGAFGGCCDVLRGLKSDRKSAVTSSIANARPVSTACTRPAAMDAGSQNKSTH